MGRGAYGATPYSWTAIKIPVYGYNVIYLTNPS